MDGNESMIALLQEKGVFRSGRIAAALRAVPREAFVPAELKTSAYENIPLPIGEGQTTSQPLTIVFMLELLQVEPGDRVFEVGTGSGWQTALLAALAGPSGKIVSYERVPRLALFAAENLSLFPEFKKTIELHTGDGTKPEPGLRFDRAIAGASAKDIPPAWKEALVPGGRLVAPVGRSVVVFHKISGDKTEMEEYPGFSFVPLVED